MFSRKFSSNIRRKKRMITSLIILLVVFLGLGYSAFSTNLGINGALKVDKYNPKIYWALQDNDNDSVNETLVLSSEEVTGQLQGNFTADTSFNRVSQVPWVTTNNYSSTSNKSYNVTTVNVAKEINPTSTAYWFQGVGYNASTFNANLGKINTSQVTNMSYMFAYTGQSATTWNIGDISDWNTSQVTNMSNMFQYAGYNATTFTADLEKLNTSQVTNMSSMFQNAGHNATTWDIGDLSTWDTSQVTDMSSMFSSSGYSATTWDIGDLSGWGTSQVTDMNRMFYYAGLKATTWDIGDLSEWNTSQVTDMKYMFNYAG